MKLNTKSLKEIERGFPVLAEQVLFAELNAEIKPKKNGDGQNLEVNCRILNEEVLKKDGSTLNNDKGKLTFKYFVSLVPTAQYDPDKSLAMIADAIKLPEDADLDIEDIQGKYVKIKLGIQPARDGRDEQNNVRALLPIKDTDDFTPPAVA